MEPLTPSSLALSSRRLEVPVVLVALSPVGDLFCHRGAVAVASDGELLDATEGQFAACLDGAGSRRQTSSTNESRAPLCKVVEARMRVSGLGCEGASKPVHGRPADQITVGRLRSPPTGVQPSMKTNV